jgi:Rho termination factor, N-terminal domain
VAEGRFGHYSLKAVSEESEKNLEEMTVSELRDRAAELEITGRSAMNKEELLQSVRDAEEQTAMLESERSNGGSGSSGESKSSEADSKGGTSESDGEVDASGIPAPSIGPHTTIEHVPPEERLDLDKISSVDAMGLDKRRQVGGKRYGASPAKQAAVYGGAIAVIVALLIGAKLLTDELDQPPAVQEDTAPWADAEQRQPAPIDFPRSTEQ